MPIDWPQWLAADIRRIISVDVETSGPNPADFALLSIGACTLVSPRKEFYVELQPTSSNSDPQSEKIHKLDLQKLLITGEPPQKAMRAFADWLKGAIPSNLQPLFLGFNAPFDWMFVCDYLHRFTGNNPFGHSALDIKSFAMGFKRVEWNATSMKQLTDTALRHNALEDARDQAALFRKIVLGSE